MKRHVVATVSIAAFALVGVAGAAWADGGVTRSSGEVVESSGTFAMYAGGPSSALAVSPDSSTVYVMADQLLAFDGTTLESRTAPATVGTLETPIALSPDGRTLYYGTSLDTENEDEYASEIHAIDLAAGSERVTRISGGSLTQIAPSPDGSTIYVAAFNGGVVSQIDAASFQVTGTTDGQPSGIAVHPDGWLYLSDYSGIVAVDPENMTPRIWDSTRLSANRSGLAVTADGSRLFAAADEDTLGLYDPRSLVEQARIDVASVRTPVLSADEDRLYIARKGTVVVIDLATGELVSKIPVASDNLTFADLVAHPTNSDQFFAVQEIGYTEARVVLVDITAQRAVPFPWWIVVVAGSIVGVAVLAVAVVLLVRAARRRPVRVRPATIPATPAVQAPVVTEALDPALAARASDPSTPLEVLAEIAYSAPNYRHLVASNPAAYEGLLEWLGQLGDPRVNEALAARGGN